jgi:hypothetical protein
LSSNSLASPPFNSNNHLNLDNKSLLEPVSGLSPKDIIANCTNLDPELKDSIIESKVQSFSECKALISTKIQQLLQSIPFQIFITLLTVCSLFMEDFRTIFVAN